MSDCCSTQTDSGSESCCTPAVPHKCACPVDGSVATAVERNTLLHHLKAPWSQRLSAENYYFCDNADCPVVYFGDDGTTFEVEQVRAPVGQKQFGPDKVLCYCYGITQGDYFRDPSIRDFVIEQTKRGSCACESRNPSGRCCLKDFPKPQEG